MEGRR
jgi:hypothetical protein